MPKPQLPIVLLESRQVAHEVRHLVFQRQDKAPFPFVPGQFVNLHFTYQGEQLQRSYSIACAPNPAEAIEIAVSYVPGGRASNYFFGLQPGNSLHMSGPFGRLILKDEQPQRYVLVATGTGVAPYRAMLSEIQTRLQQVPALTVELVLGVRRLDDLLYGQEFIDFANQHPRFRFWACLSQAQTLPEGSPHLRRGRVTALLSELALDPASDIIYLCGNPDMIDSAFQQCSQLGFTHKNVRREKYVLSVTPSLS